MWIYLDQSKQRGLKLASGQNRDLWLQWEFGEKEGMLCGHARWLSAGIGLSKHIRREEQVRGHSGRYRLGRHHLGRHHLGRQRESFTVSPLSSQIRTLKNQKGKFTVFTVLTGIRMAALWMAAAALRSGAGHSARAWVGPRKRGASPGHGRAGSSAVSLCSCWTSCSFRRSSWGDTTPGTWEAQADQNKKKQTSLNSIHTYLNIPRQQINEINVFCQALINTKSLHLYPG